MFFLGDHESVTEMCHKLTYSRKTGSKIFKDYSDTEQMLLKMWSGIDIPKDAMICLHHEEIFI